MQPNGVKATNRLSDCSIELLFYIVHHFGAAFQVIYNVASSFSKIIVFFLFFSKGKQFRECQLYRLHFLEKKPDTLKISGSNQNLIFFLIKPKTMLKISTCENEKNSSSSLLPQICIPDHF